MKCNNAIVKYHDSGRYSLTIPLDKQEEKQAVLKEAVEKYNGYCYTEISRVKRPRSLEQNNLFHALLGVYYLSGCHSSKTLSDLKMTLKARYGIKKEFVVDDETITMVKHTADYKVDEFTPLIDGTIKEMFLTGVSSKKFDEILEGINYDS